MLTNPIFLWSLLGLSVPIAVHLLSRKEGKVIRIGSIRHIQETSTQQFKGIKLNELLLLALRCVMIIIFALLLSGLQCTSLRNEKWVVVEKSLENLPSIKIILDSLRKEGYEQHQLAEGFPMTLSDDTVSEINYWKLAEQLESMNLSHAVVFASNRLENFKGMRIPLMPNLKWISVSLSQEDYPLQAIQLDSDSIFLRMGHSNGDESYFETEKTKTLTHTISVSSPDSIRVLIVSDDSYGYDRGIIIAALKGMENAFPIKLKIIETNSFTFSTSKVDWCIWLSDKKPHENNSLRLISLHLRKSNNLLIHFKSNEWELTKHLNEEVALEGNLTLQFAELIIPSMQLREIANTKDRRMMPDSMVWAQADSKKTEAAILPSPADHFLVILLLIILFVERVIAYKRNQ